MNIELEPRPERNEVRVVVMGEISSRGGRKLEKRLKRLMFKGVDRIKVDFTSVDDVDSDAASSILAAGRLAKQEGAKLELVNVERPVFEFLLRQGFKRVFKPVY